MTQENLCPRQRVAFVTGVLDLGGTTTFMCNLAAEFLQRGIAVQVFSFERANPLAEDFARRAIPVFAVDGTRLIFEDRLACILRELAAFRPSVVIANLASTSFEALRYVPGGVTRVGTVQSDDPGMYETVRQYAPWVDIMAAVSRTVQTALRSLPEYSGKPVSYQPYGVPMPAVERASTRFGSEPLRILYLGRLERSQKRVELFPTILEGLRASGIPFQWTIAGTGPEEGYLRTALRSERADQAVSFAGKIAYADVPELLAGHDVFLLASGFEGLPLSLLEAMGQGLVPVVSDLASGIREVVDAHTGKLVPPERVAGYAEAIVELHRDREQLRHLSANAQKRVWQEFSTRAMAERWLDLLPAPERQSPVWPSRWNIQPILVSEGRWHFSPPMRFLRRMLKRVRR